MPAADDNSGQLTDALARAAEKAFGSPFGGVLKLAPDQGPALWVDGRGARPAVSPEAPSPAPAAKGRPKDQSDTNDAPGDREDAALCVWRGARESLIRALAGERAFESAFVSGRIAVSGDMSLMARLALEGGR